MKDSGHGKTIVRIEDRDGRMVFGFECPRKALIYKTKSTKEAGGYYQTVTIKVKISDLEPEQKP